MKADDYVQSLIERDTPKKIETFEGPCGEVWAGCPQCGLFIRYVDESALERMRDSERHRFCDCCGQRLDWGKL